jgi:hypothetical protein
MEELLNDVKGHLGKQAYQVYELDSQGPSQSFSPRVSWKEKMLQITSFSQLIGMFCQVSESKEAYSC